MATLSYLTNILDCYYISYYLNLENKSINWFSLSDKIKEFHTIIEVISDNILNENEKSFLYLKQFMDITRSSSEKRTH